MKKQLIIASAALMFGTFACKKNETTPPLQNQGIETNPSTNEVVQKMYDIDTEHTTEIIKKFKSKFLTSNNFRNTENSNSLALDSSIWLLEAALNYDFDFPKTIEIGYKDSLKYRVSTISNSVISSDFGTTYIALANLLSQKINSTTKIQVIDITAKNEGDSILYFCDITLFHTTNGQKIATPCDPFTSEIASPSLYPTTSGAYSNFFLNCSGNPTLDGPSQVEIKLNSCSFPSCSNGYYYTNVVSRQFWGYQYPQYLYNKTIYSYSDYCLNANKQITATDLNRFKNGSNYLATTYKPTSPAGLSIINSYDILLEIDGQICCYWPHYVTWKLVVQYGTLNCNSGGGN